jgi:hypothetical protein
VIPPATVIDYLDTHAGAFTALLTAVLILVTVYYAVQNQRMVGEMRKTRELALLPKLALEFHHLAPAVVSLAVKNVGPGAALGIDVRVIYEPIGEAASEERRWRRNVLVSCEQHDFRPPGELNDNINALPEHYRMIRLVGSMRDAAGKAHDVDEVFENLADWREVLHASGQRYVAEPERRLADALGKKLEGPLRTLAQRLQGITTAVRELTPPSPEDAEDA